MTMEPSFSHIFPLFLYHHYQPASAMEGIRAGPTGQTSSHEKQDQNSERDASPVPPTPQTLSPKQGAEAMVESGVTRHSQRIDVLFLKAVWAGIFLSYGGFLESVIGGSPSANANNPGLLRLVEGLVFPVGLAMIVLSGMELLTSDMMFFYMAALKGRIPWWSVIYSYAVVFCGNLAGSLFYAFVLVKYTGLVTDDISTFVTNAAHSRAVVANFREIFLRGIGCNIMVCMAVYLAAMGSDLFSKVVGIWIPLGTFVVLQYEHVVADMFTLPLGISLGADGVSVGLYIWKTLIGAFLGNLLGALLLGTTLYWLYLHDTTAPIVPVNGHANGHTNGDAEVGGLKPVQKKKKVGPFGRGTYGNPTKLQKSLWHESGHTRHHF